MPTATPPAPSIQHQASHVWFPFDVYPDAPRPRIVRAEGSWLYADDGRQYLDLISSWWVNLHGHGHPRLVAAVQAQAAVMDQVIFAGLSHPGAEELAARLVALYPGMETGGRCFYSDDGSTAVEVAIKMALHYQQLVGWPEAVQVLTLANSYHGDTVGAMSVAEPGVFTRAYAPFMFAARVLPVPERQVLEGPLLPAEAAALTALEPDLATGRFAALIVEPGVQGAGGMRFVGTAYLQGLVALCRHYGVLVIYDEVMTGFHRTGPLFAAERLGPDARPDLACLSKGLTGGFLPLGVTLAQEHIYEAFAAAPVRERFLHGHSFTANPVCCAVALESLALLQEPETQAHLATLTAALAALAGRWRGHPALSAIRHTGPLLALELVPPAHPLPEGERGYLNPVRLQAYTYMLERGLLLRPLGRVLYLLPPYTISAEELALAAEGIEAFLELKVKS